MKRVHQLDYEFHCLSKKVIKICLENHIKNLVVGHNSGWKQNVDLGKKNNQNFV